MKFLSLLWSVAVLSVLAVSGQTSENATECQCPTDPQEGDTVPPCCASQDPDELLRAQISLRAEDLSTLETGGLTTDCLAVARTPAQQEVCRRGSLSQQCDMVFTLPPRSLGIAASEFCAKVQNIQQIFCVVELTNPRGSEHLRDVRANLTRDNRLRSGDWNGMLFTEAFEKCAAAQNAFPAYCVAELFYRGMQLEARSDFCNTAKDETQLQCFLFAMEKLVPSLNSNQSMTLCAGIADEMPISEEVFWQTVLVKRGELARAGLDPGRGEASNNMRRAFWYLPLAGKCKQVQLGLDPQVKEWVCLPRPVSRNPEYHKYTAPYGNLVSKTLPAERRAVQQAMQFFVRATPDSQLSFRNDHFYSHYVRVRPDVIPDTSRAVDPNDRGFVYPEGAFAPSRQPPRNVFTRDMRNLLNGMLSVEEFSYYNSLELLTDMDSMFYQMKRIGDQIQLMETETTEWSDADWVSTVFDMVEFTKGQREVFELKLRYERLLFMKIIEDRLKLYYETSLDMYNEVFAPYYKLIADMSQQRDNDLGRVNLTLANWAAVYNQWWNAEQLMPSITDISTYTTTPAKWCSPRGKGCTDHSDKATCGEKNCNPA